MRVLMLFVIVASLAVLFTQLPPQDSGAPANERKETLGAAQISSGEQEILRAFNQEISGLWVEAFGSIDRILPDDTRGSQHQRFILSLPSGHSLLVSHNIDLAPRLEEVRVGDEIKFRGKYEWNAKGGVIHWTHHDPDGKNAGGWLSHKDRRYR